jgi:hypothetical protein
MLVLLLAAQAAAPHAADAIEHYRQLTAAEPRCERAVNTTDVTVCGLRDADRFRVPFVFPEPGDPLHEAAMDERKRYLARTDNCQEKNLFLVGCGAFGLSVTTGGGREGVEVRPLAK